MGKLPDRRKGVNFLFDYHIHSNYSIDSKMSMSDACIKAMELGLNEIAFTDHIDLDWPDNLFPTFNIHTLDKYIDEIEGIREKFRNFLTVRKGVEIGLQPHTLEQCSKIVTSYPFDFVIASVHIVGRKDPSLPAYFENKNKEQSFISYYKEILSLIETFDEFSVLGHLDYVKRYSPYPYKEDDTAIGSDIINEILKTLIRKNKGIEVNTSGYRHVSNSPMPHFDVIKRYRELGGEIITLGSDAHHTRYIGLNFQEALMGIKAAGFNHLTTFFNRKPHLFVPESFQTLDTPCS